jgi:hypothetical protein
MTIEEDSYNDQYKPLPGDAQGSPHPIVWYRDGQAVLRANMARPWTSISNTTSWDSRGMFRPPGRVWYTGLGHREETWRDETFQSHIQGGIDWVLGVNTTKPKPVISSTANNPSAVDLSEEDSHSAATTTHSRFTQTTIYGLVASSFLFHVVLMI